MYMHKKGDLQLWLSIPSSTPASCEWRAWTALARRDWQLLEREQEDHNVASMSRSPSHARVSCHRKGEREESCSSEARL